MKPASYWRDKLHALDYTAPMRVMNVCGGHERVITMGGLRGVIPSTIELIPGPGCPVCVCPEEDIYQAIQLGLCKDVILVAFGDMLRVPIHAAKKDIRSLEQAKAAGADIRPIASPLEAVRIAKDNPQKQVVFFAAGFETTAAPVAAMLLEFQPDNLSVLLSARLTWPVVAALLHEGDVGFNALIAPGHVATVMGADEWRFVVEDYHLPCAVAGFEPRSLLAALYAVVCQHRDHAPHLENCYPELVSDAGNCLAQQQMRDAFAVVDANWRGIGVIPQSGVQLSSRFAAMDARLRFAERLTPWSREGGMPPGCDCAKVILGKIYPNQCRLYGTACTPRDPVGPCMVSDEGACRIWWSGGTR
jgi:hydrogenase expression/formation protein HypD